MATLHFTWVLGVGIQAIRLVGEVLFRTEPSSRPNVKCYHVIHFFEKYPRHKIAEGKDSLFWREEVSRDLTLWTRLAWSSLWGTGYCPLASVQENGIAGVFYYHTSFIGLIIMCYPAPANLLTPHQHELSMN